jgi:hypothetical protein
LRTYASWFPGTKVTSCAGPTVSSQTRGREFARERDIEDIAGHGDVVRVMRLDVVDDARQHLGAVECLPAPVPVHVADGALAREVADAGRGHGAEMRVGQMRENEHERTVTAFGG